MTHPKHDLRRFIDALESSVTLNESKELNEVETNTVDEAAGIATSLVIVGGTIAFLEVMRHAGNAVNKAFDELGRKLKSNATWSKTTLTAMVNYMVRHEASLRLKGVRDGMWINNTDDAKGNIWIIQRSGATPGGKVSPEPDSSPELSDAAVKETPVGILFYGMDKKKPKNYHYIMLGKTKIWTKSNPEAMKQFVYDSMDGMVSVHELENIPDLGTGE